MGAATLTIYKYSTTKLACKCCCKKFNQYKEFFYCGLIIFSNLCDHRKQLVGCGGNEPLHKLVSHPPPPKKKTKNKIVP